MRFVLRGGSERGRIGTVCVPRAQIEMAPGSVLVAGCGLRVAGHVCGSVMGQLGHKKPRRGLDVVVGCTVRVAQPASFTT